MKNEKKLDIFDILPSEAFSRIDELGYSFLEENGYDTEGAAESEDKRKNIKCSLKEKREELRYFGAFDKDTGAILIWYELYRGKEKISTSKGLRFLPKPTEE